MSSSCQNSILLSGESRGAFKQFGSRLALFLTLRISQFDLQSLHLRSLGGLHLGKLADQSIGGGRLVRSHIAVRWKCTGVAQTGKVH